MRRFLLHILPEEVSYLPTVKGIVINRASVAVSNKLVSMLYEFVLMAKEKEVSQIATTSPDVLKLLLEETGKKVGKAPSTSDYAGSIISYRGLDFLILPPLEHLHTVSHGKFLFERYIRKFIRPEAFISVPEFCWELFHPAKHQELLAFFQDCLFIACDIETVRDDIDRTISCIGFTGIQIVQGKIRLRTVVLPLDEEYNLVVMRQILALPCAKVFQNGKYDIVYLLRYNAPVTNYAFDTINLFHSWYSELPKSLDFITSFMLLKWQFWKSESKTGNQLEYYQYNAKDCFVTAWTFVALMAELPVWAAQNFLAEFPLVFPCLLSEMTGLRRDAVVMDKELARFEEISAARLKKLQVMVANANFNPGSPLQTVKLMEILGSKDIKSSNVANVGKFVARHPLNARIFNEITSYRKDRKLVTSYLRDKDPKDGTTKSWHGRIFYSLNPHGTDTTRLASKESAFWCGWQIQNMPRGRKDIEIKRGIIADPGFYFGECDKAQAEARYTAYLSGDEALITAVDDTTKDFHGVNAAAFFGIAYDQIVKSSLASDGLTWVHDVTDKALRDLAKRTNHGSNYNMGPQVMLDTMGIENVLRARYLLKLPTRWSLLQVTTHLLDVYAKTYPVVKGPWYDKVKSDVALNKTLVGPTGLTRYCFGNPSANKRDLNRYVAHPPQALSAQQLNKMFLRVYREVWLPNQADFKLSAQIHDSILFQYRIGRIDLAKKVQECMHIPVEVTDTFGKIRTCVIPTDLKGEANRWSALVAI